MMMDDTAKPKDLAKQNAPDAHIYPKRAFKSEYTIEHNERLNTLEMHVAHLEDTVEKLNTVVAAQDKALAEQYRLIKKLAQTLEAAKTHGAVTAFDVVADKPPHY